MPVPTDYIIQRNKKNLVRLGALLNELPDFCSEFFRGVEPHTSILTRINYAYDLRLFFNFLVQNIDIFMDRKVKDLSLEDLDRVEIVHMEKFLSWLSSYECPENPEVIVENHEKGKARKLAAVRTLYKHFYKKQKIKSNPASLIDTPKIHEKAIIRLEPDEVAKLLDAVENGAGLTEKQRQFHQSTKKRDFAILMLFLGTGIRISECVGINISDLDFNVNGFRIVRKGGNEVILYFSDEVAEALQDYLEERKRMEPLPGHEDALFLSLQRKRISTYAVQDLVKKYAKIVVPLKNISPHKLRSTYGTTLYRETGDIYLTAEVLGHKDVNTTKKHYAAISEERRKLASKAIRLR